MNSGHRRSARIVCDRQSDGDHFLASFDALDILFRRSDGKDAFGRQRRADSLNFNVTRQEVLARKLARNITVFILLFLVASFDNDARIHAVTSQCAFDSYLRRTEMSTNARNQKVFRQSFAYASDQ